MSTKLTPTTSERTLGGARPAHEDSLSIPKHLWSPPIAEASRGAAPRLSRLIVLFPAVALVSAYLAAASAAREHVLVGGWLLGLAVTAIVSGAVVFGVHAHRLARYRSEVPR